jgi:hypothetical protein
MPTGYMHCIKQVGWWIRDYIFGIDVLTSG